jgi:hypothetical protein
LYVLEIMVQGCCPVQSARGIQPGRGVRRQAQAAHDEEWRTFFSRLRDSWVRVANNYQIASRWPLTPRRLALPG